MKFELYPNIKFDEFVDNCEVLRTQYMELLTPFFNVQAIRYWKNMIYSLNFAYWKRDKIWEYLNLDIELEELIAIKNKWEEKWKN